MEIGIAMKNKQAEPECDTEIQIRQALINANGNGWWQMAAELAGELHLHHKQCPTCNPTISQFLLSALFRGDVRVE
jgi:hypothetical protein